MQGAPAPCLVVGDELTFQAALKLQRKYPQFSQEEVMSLVSRFKCVSPATVETGADRRSSAIDIDGKGSVAKPEVITSLSTGGQAEGTYDAVRTTLKEVAVDASGKVELDDYVDLVAKLREGRNRTAGQAVGKAGAGGKGRVVVQGSNANITHGILPDELAAFTNHINGVGPILAPSRPR